MGGQSRATKIKLGRGVGNRRAKGNKLKRIRAMNVFMHFFPTHYFLKFSRTHFNINY